jgi:hypothetical protein
MNFLDAKAWFAETFGVRTPKVDTRKSSSQIAFSGISCGLWQDCDRIIFM